MDAPKSASCEVSSRGAVAIWVQSGSHTTHGWLAGRARRRRADFRKSLRVDWFGSILLGRVFEVIFREGVPSSSDGLAALVADVDEAADYDGSCVHLLPQVVQMDRRVRRELEMNDPEDLIYVDTPPTRFQSGDRVRLTPDHPWAPGATGTLGAFPREVRELLGSTPATPAELRESFSGPDPEANVFYWVLFDEAVLDDEGHSLEAAEVLSAHLAREKSDGEP